eukprot:jgi/Botrbrau1/8451/Bobra.0237s0068.1
MYGPPSVGRTTMTWLAGTHSLRRFPLSHKQFWRIQMHKNCRGGHGRKFTLILCALDVKIDVLVIGGGGREHALAWKLRQSPLCNSLYCSPANFGISTELGVQVVPSLDASNNSEVVKWCLENNIGLVVVGPEAPLVTGLVDALQEAGVRAFGPTAAAARLEGSKGFLKELCRKYKIPTAEFQRFTDANAAKAYVRERGAPIVVKADGLAAGKGVIVAEALPQALSAIDSMLLDRQFGDAGSEIVVEECLRGEEVSFFALVDGDKCIALGSAQDHKAVGEGDTGPNTGGMGAYSPAPVLTPDLEQQVMEQIIRRTAQAMVSEGVPFRGVLFAGLMIQNGQAKLLEHNVRFGDPECQCLMVRLASDLLQLLLEATDGTLGTTAPGWRDEAALTVILAARGYPGSYQKGTQISGLERVTPAKVFHAGTSQDSHGNVVANGGRVLAITATGRDIAEAQRKAYEGVDSITWPDGFCRRDIGWRAIARLPQPPSTPDRLTAN